MWSEESLGTVLLKVWMAQKFFRFPGWKANFPTLWLTYACFSARLGWERETFVCLWRQLRTAALFLWEPRWLQGLHAIIPVKRLLIPSNSNLLQLQLDSNTCGNFRYKSTPTAVGRAAMLQYFDKNFEYTEGRGKWCNACRGVRVAYIINHTSNWFRSELRDEIF